MASAKKPATTTKKAASKRTSKSAAKTTKSTAKKSVAKSTRTTRSRKPATPEVVSFKLAPETARFLDLSFTRQTVYWIILLTFVSILAVWVLKLHLAVVEIYDTIEMNNTLYSTLSLPVDNAASAS